jgi:hypothetical protein
MHEGNTDAFTQHRKQCSKVVGFTCIRAVDDWSSIEADVVSFAINEIEAVLMAINNAIFFNMFPSG